VSGIKRHIGRLRHVESVRVDGGYTGNPLPLPWRKRWEPPSRSAKRSEWHTFAVIPKRWVVETKPFGWF